MSNAARDLGMTQPSVSERVEKLERFLGNTLLLRSGRSVHCTEAGKVFYEHSVRLLIAATNTLEAVKTSSQGLGGTLRIAAPYCYGEKVVTPALIKAQLDHPSLGTKLTLNDAIVDPITEGVDISIRLGNNGDGRYVAYPIGRVERILVASRDYVSQHEPIRQLADLAKHPFIRVQGIFEHEMLSFQAPTSEPMQAKIHTRCVTSHWRPMFDMILDGVGIGVVQQPGCVEELAAGNLVRLLPQCDIPFFPVTALVPPRKPMPEKFLEIISRLRALTTKDAAATTS